MSPQRSTRSFVPRLDRRTLLGLGLGCLAALLVLTLTRPEPGTEVLVAAHDIPAGTPLEDTAVETRSLPDAAGMVARAAVPDLGDLMLTAPVAAGEPLLRSQVVPAELRSNPNLFALAVAETHAVLGHVVAGDRLDLFVTHPGNGVTPATTELLAENIFVIEARPGENALAANPTVELLVAVDDDLAHRLAAAVRGGEIDIVKRSQ